jgi:hypothetical protein
MADETDIMGILSIVYAFLIAPIGLILGIVGYSGRKRKGQDTTLSMIGMIISGLFTLVFVLVMGIAFIAAFGAFNRPLMEGCFSESPTIVCNAPVIGVTRGNEDAAIMHISLRNELPSSIVIEDVELEKYGSCGSVMEYEALGIDGAEFNPPNTVERREVLVVKITCAPGTYRENKDYTDTFAIKYAHEGLSGISANVRVVART